MIDHVGIYGSREAEGLSAFNVGLVYRYLWPGLLVPRRRVLIWIKSVKTFKSHSSIICIICVKTG